MGAKKAYRSHLEACLAALGELNTYQPECDPHLEECSEGVAHFVEEAIARLRQHDVGGDLDACPCGACEENFAGWDVLRGGDEGIAKAAPKAEPIAETTSAKWRVFKTAPHGERCRGTIDHGNGLLTSVLAPANEKPAREPFDPAWVQAGSTLRHGGYLQVVTEVTKEGLIRFNLMVPCGLDYVSSPCVETMEWVEGKYAADELEIVVRAALRRCARG